MVISLRLNLVRQNKNKDTCVWMCVKCWNVSDQWMNKWVAFLSLFVLLRPLLRLCSILNFFPFILNLCCVFLTWAINCQLNGKTGYSLKFLLVLFVVVFSFVSSFHFLSLYSLFCSFVLLLLELFRWNIISLLLSVYSACFRIGFYLWWIQYIPLRQSFSPFRNIVDWN